MNMDLTAGKPEKVLWKFCLPLFGSILFQQLYNIADSFVAGKYIGEQALAAVGNSYEITLIFIAFAFGCNIGCSVLVSRLFGARQYRELKTAVKTSMTATFVTCLTLMALGFASCGTLLRLIQTPADVFDDSRLYLDIYMLGLPFVFFYNLSTGIFSALGDSRTPFWFLAVSSVSNIFMDILFVSAFKMGVAGVAWATFLCQGVSCVLAVAFVARRLKAIPCHEKSPHFSRQMLSDFARIAIPSTLQQSFVSVGNILIQGIINGFGSGVMAGYSASIKLNNLVITSFTTIGNGISNYTAQNLGAGKVERVREGYRAGLKMVWIICAPIVALYLLAGGSLVRLFMDAPSADALSTGVIFLRIVSPFYFLISVKLVADGILRGSSRMKEFMICTFTDLILRVILAAILSAQLGSIGIWCSWPIGWAVGTVLSVHFYKKEFPPMSHKSSNQQITEGVIWKQLLSFFFPILLGAFFQQMYNTVDTIIVGRYVGTHALAAVGSTNALISLINGFFVGLSTGATVLLSQFYGANDRQGVHNAVHTGMGLSLVLGGLTMVMGIFAGPRILKISQTPANIIEDAALYTVIFFSGSVASMVYNMGAGILRAMGDSRRPMLYLIVTCFVNIALDLIFVVWFKLGVAGVAIATVLAQVVSAALVIWALCRLEEGVRLRFRDIRLEKQLMKRILYVGIPAGLQFVTFDLANLLIQSGINSFGDITVAAWAAFTKTDSMTWMISGAFGVSITTFVGQNFGAQKYDRIRKGVWVCMGMSVALVGALSAAVMIFREFILGIYTTDQDVIRTGAYIMSWIVPYAVIFMPVEVFAGTMRGTGYSVMPTIITCTSVCVFRVLWIFTIVRNFHTIPMLALCYPISWVLAAITFFIAYLRGTWLTKRIEACGMAPEVR